MRNRISAPVSCNMVRSVAVLAHNSRTHSGPEGPRARGPVGAADAMGGARWIRAGERS